MPAETSHVRRAAQSQQDAADQIQVRDDDDVMEHVEDGARQRSRRQQAEAGRRVADVADQIERQHPAEVALVQRRHESDRHGRGRHGEEH